MLRSLEQRRGYKVKARDGLVGRARDFLFDDALWTIRYMIVETKRFLGDQCLITPHLIAGVIDEDRSIQLAMDRETVAKSPPVDADQPISRRYQRIYLGYYGLPTWWENADVAGIIPPSMAPPGSLSDHYGDPHLRSANQVKGYRAVATDGELGNVKDYIVDDDWRMRYLVVDANRLWFGRWILLCPTWIQQINWPDRLVRLNVTRAKVRASPVWHPGQPVAGDYETRLLQHYGMDKPQGPGI